MGADIHMFLEKRTHPKLPWKLDERHILPDGSIRETSAGNRDYSLFGLIAGVRANRVMYRAKGLPDNCDSRVRKYFVDVGFHTPSYLSPHEFKKALLKNYYIWRKHDVDHYQYNALTREDIFFEWKNLFFNKANYDDIVNDLIFWEFGKYLDNHMYGTKHRPESRIVFFFDS